MAPYSTFWGTSHCAMLSLFNRGGKPGFQRQSLVEPGLHGYTTHFLMPLLSPRMILCAVWSSFISNSSKINSPFPQTLESDHERQKVIKQFKVRLWPPFSNKHKLQINFTSLLDLGLQSEMGQKRGSLPTEPFFLHQWKKIKAQKIKFLQTETEIIVRKLKINMEFPKYDDFIILKWDAILLWHLYQKAKPGHHSY